MKERQARQSNIELLRILAMLGVIILHYNNVDAGGGFKYVAEGSLNYYILYILESVTICAVDLFILISGYFLSATKRRVLWKPIELLSQVMLFNLGIYLVRSIIAGYKLTAKAVISSMIPANYFVVLYIVVYIISPYINLLLEALTRKQLDVFVGILIVLFSVCPTFVDVLSVITDREWQGLSTIGMYGSQRGYTIVNFVLMYIVGAYMRSRGFPKASKQRLALSLMFSILAMTAWAMWNRNTAWEYCNPLVILTAGLIFLLFAQLKICDNKFINHLAKGTFSVFLLHSVFLRYISVDIFVAGNPLVMLLHILVSSVGIYMICWVGYYLYSAVTKPVFRKLAQWIKLPVLDISG